MSLAADTGNINQSLGTYSAYYQWWMCTRGL